MSKKITTEQFIERSKLVHGDRYDYSDCIYKKMTSDIILKCSKHGNFFQKPYYHLSGIGCRKCYIEGRHSNNDTFINAAKKIHGEKYDYTLVKYIKSNQKVEIICVICNKSFWQKPNDHLNGCGCPNCKRVSFNDFLQCSKKKHGDKYDYSLVNCDGCFNKIKIICPIHGIFLQTLRNHMSGHGCTKCVIEKRIKRITLTIDEFISRSKKIHGDKYDYSKVDYRNSQTNVKIICSNHGPFLQTPSTHIRGYGCQKCTHRISKPEIEFLDFIKCPLRSYIFPEWKQKSVDGYEPNTNTVYEFLGDYYHGNPEKYDSEKYNQICHKTFGELYNRTINNLSKLKSLGYNVKYIWEKDWNEFKKGTVPSPNIQVFNN